MSRFSFVFMSDLLQEEIRARSRETKSGFTVTILLANSADEKLVIFFLFSQKTRYDISC